MTDNNAYIHENGGMANGYSHQNGVPATKVLNGDTLTDSTNPNDEHDPEKVKLEEEEREKEERTCWQKTKPILATLGRAVTLLACLYFFICSLNLLSSGFILIGGRYAGDAFGENPLLSNPICGLMLGVVSTAFLQSSSTSTSIVVTMVASGILTVPLAIPIIMGANIGTSVTGILVATTQAGDREQFRKAFTGATVHDMFNWLTVITLLPIEIATGYLYRLTSLMVDATSHTGGGSKQEFLSVLTSPFTDIIVQVDKGALQKIATKEDGWETIPLLKYWCEKKSVLDNSTATNSSNYMDIYDAGSLATTQLTTTPYPTKIIGIKQCSYLFHDTGMSEQLVGGLVVLIALVLLIGCLIIMVAVLKSILAGPMAKVIQKTINADFPGKAACLTGYVAILVGAIATILVQSSSVVTSGLTPLVGLGMVTVQRVFPMLLGANIGTTSTALLAAFAAPSERFTATLQIALCHLFFNLTGILIWYPLPFMRKAPIGLATFLGKTTSRYRWFAIMYLVCMFFLIPLTIFGLSIPGWQVLAGVGIPVIVLLITIAIINLLQNKHPAVLPVKMRTWEFLPEPMRSLAPMDRQVSKLIACCSCCECCKKLDQNNREENKPECDPDDYDCEKGQCNSGFDPSDDGTVAVTVSSKSPYGYVEYESIKL